MKKLSHYSTLYYFGLTILNEVQKNNKLKGNEIDYKKRINPVAV